MTMTDDQLTEALARVYQNRADNSEEIAYDFIKTNFGDQIEPDAPKPDNSDRLRGLRELIEKSNAHISHCGIPIWAFGSDPAKPEEPLPVPKSESSYEFRYIGPPAPFRGTKLEDRLSRVERYIADGNTEDLVSIREDLPVPPKSDKEVILEYMGHQVGQHLDNRKLYYLVYPEGEFSRDFLNRQRAIDSVTFDWNFLIKVEQKLWLEYDGWRDRNRVYAYLKTEINAIKLMAAFIREQSKTED